MSCTTQIIGFCLPLPLLSSRAVSRMSTQKTAMDHPPYNTMIAEAIATLADRSGSSLAAIKKHIGSKYNLKEGWERKVCTGVDVATVLCPIDNMIASGVLPHL